MVRCEGRDECRKIHVPFVDTHIERMENGNQVRVSTFLGSIAFSHIDNIISLRLSLTP